jgi:hypothetical protein
MQRELLRNHPAHRDSHQRGARDAERVASEPYSPVGWSNCAGGFSQRCWDLAESKHDTALLPDVDQNLALRLNSEKIRSYEELVDRFDETNLAELKSPWGKRLPKVGPSKATSILAMARVMMSKQELVN